MHQAYKINQNKRW